MNVDLVHPRLLIERDGKHRGQLFDPVGNHLSGPHDPVTLGMLEGFDAICCYFPDLILKKQILIIPPIVLKIERYTFDVF